MPYQGLSKISDLLFQEGPLLSHFKDKHNNNLFFLGVDKNTKFNRCLVFNITEVELCNYLEGRSSLLDLFNSPESDYVFTVDIDKNGEHHHINLFDKTNDLKPLNKYLPNIDDFFHGEIPEQYDRLLEKYKDNQYLADLKSRAIYLKLSSDNVKYHQTIGIKQIKDFLDTIIKSFEAFSLIDFKKSLQKAFPNAEKLDKAALAVTRKLEPRLVDINYQDFSIGIATDYFYFTQDTSVRGVKTWAKNILQKYKKEVLELDYNANEELRKIVKRYTPEERSKIYEPVIKILKDPDVSISTSDKKGKKKKVIKAPVKRNEYKLVPKKETPVKPERQEVKLMNMIVELPSDGGVAKLTKRSLGQATLFSQEIDSYHAKDIELITGDDKKITFKEKAAYQVELKDNKEYHINFLPLDVIFKIPVNHKKPLKTELADKILTLFEVIKKRRKPPKKEKAILEKLSAIIEKVEVVKKEG